MLAKIVEAGEILETEGELAALRFASRLRCLGASRDVIQRGYSAHSNPAFYRELGEDPSRLVRLGIEALRSLIEVNRSS